PCPRMSESLPGASESVGSLGRFSSPKAIPRIREDAHPWAWVSTRTSTREPRTPTLEPRPPRSDRLARTGLNVLVLAGGPDRERAVSLKSGAEVAAALRAAGHSVREADIHPDDLSALDAFVDWPGDVVFPVLHGKWGEGGGLQRILDERGLPYVGCGGPAAKLCMDKYRTKLALVAQGLPTPPFEFVGVGQPITLRPPLVVKAPDE